MRYSRQSPVKWLRTHYCYPQASEEIYWALTKLFTRSAHRTRNVKRNPFTKGISIVIWPESNFFFLRRVPMVYMTQDSLIACNHTSKIYIANLKRSPVLQIIISNNSVRVS